MSKREEGIVVFGDLQVDGKDISVVNVKFDKLAISRRNELLLMSIIADTQRVKQIRAILCGGAKAVVQASGAKVNRPGGPTWDAFQPGRLIPTPDGYDVYTHKLGYGMAHALFITRMPGFMKVVTPESLWQELNDIRYTTPVLKDWVPHIERELRENDLLEDANVFNCQCGVLSALTKQLDDIVSEGLARRQLVIPSSSLAA
jgi:hypothetical protein